MTHRFLFLKATQGELFADLVPIAGHVRHDGTVVRPTFGIRRKRSAEDAPREVAPPPAAEVRPPSLADFPEDAIIEQALAILENRMRNRRMSDDVIGSPQATRDFIKLRIGNLEHEVFGCIFMDNRNRPIKATELFRGTVDGASVHRREVVKEALKSNAAAVIFYHNHPSGIGEPSQADMLITQRLKEALNQVEIRVLDHVIVAEGPAYSFAEHGIL